jgi:amphi-Trp domain-containing protein
MADSTFEITGEFERERIAAMLEDMALGLRSGELELERDGVTVQLAPANGIGLQIQADNANGSEWFAMRMEWPKP